MKIGDSSLLAATLKCLAICSISSKVNGDLPQSRRLRRFAAEPALDRRQGDARCRRKDLDALASGSEQRPDIRYGEFVET